MDLKQKLRESVFYGILDTGYVAKDMMFEKCKQLIDGGCGLIQLRAKKETHLEREKIAEEILPLFRSENAPIFIINDDIELAMQIDIAGLHIGQDDMPPEMAREFLGKNKVLGLSTHSIEQAKNADALSDILDYFAVGPLFATQTKPGRIPVGLELASEVKAMRPKLPWFCIGGVNLNTVESVAKSGAERIVAVSDVLKPEDTSFAVRELTRKFLLHKTA